MRCESATAEVSTLRDAEFVLLIDYDQAELRKPHVLLDQCLRPDDQLHRAAFHLRESLSSLRLGETAGQ